MFFSCSLVEYIVRPDALILFQWIISTRLKKLYSSNPKSLLTFVGNRCWRDLAETSEKTSEKIESKKREGDYPVSESFRVLEGYDIYRSEKLIVALVVVDSDFGRDLRLYRWQKRNEAWKVDLCRMSVAGWHWDTLALKVKELFEKYEIGKKNRQK